jgi:hypothetical protein
MHHLGVGRSDGDGDGVRIGRLGVVAADVRLL